MTTLQVRADIDRLSAELEELASYTEAEPPAVTRVVFSDTDVKARSYVKRLFREAGLEVREDPIGNTFARWSGRRPELPAVGTGSHIDAIPNAGRYDGTVGVLGGLEAIRALKQAGFQPTRSIELLLFTSEEPTRFGIGCVGSRALAAALSPSELAELRDLEGNSLKSLRQHAGFSGPLDKVRLPSDCYSAFVELHIEQGPVLDREAIPIGVVTGIAAPAALRIELEGEGGHAGTVLMPQRKDALCGAAEIVLAVEKAAQSTGSADTVATTGVCCIRPGAINSIPSRATLEIDIRDVAKEARDRAVEEIRQAAEAVARRRGLKLALAMLHADPPAACGERIVTAVENACRQLGLPSKRMPSRAYHDSLFMARLCPVGMIFIPCKDGISHRPDEYAKPEDIRHGVEVLALTLAELSGDDADVK